MHFEANFGIGIFNSCKYCPKSNKTSRTNRQYIRITNLSVLFIDNLVPKNKIVLRHEMQNKINYFHNTFVSSLVVCDKLLSDWLSLCQHIFPSIINQWFGKNPKFESVSLPWESSTNQRLFMSWQRFTNIKFCQIKSGRETCWLITF